MDRSLGESLARRVAALYLGVELDLLRMVADRLTTDKTGGWRAGKAAQVEALRVAAQERLRRSRRDTQDVIPQVLADAYAASQQAAVNELADLGRDATVRMTPPAIQAAAETLARQSLLVDGAIERRALRATTDLYQQVTAQAATSTLLGATTRRDATQAAIREATRNGLTGFTDTKGRRWALDTYTEMATRTAAGRAALEGHTQVLTDSGIRLVVVSDSPRECELCRPWEGKILSIDGTVTGRVELQTMTGDGAVTVNVAGSLDEARAAGFQHPNCSHRVTAYIPGATRLREPESDPAGYAAQQEQRALERRVRAEKIREATALDDTTRRDARARVRAAQGDLRTHLNEHPDLKRQYAREQIGEQPTPAVRP